MKKKSGSKNQNPTNADWQGVDKDPKEEKGKAEPVEMINLKGKKVDGNPEEESDKPAKIDLSTNSK